MQRPHDLPPWRACAIACAALALVAGAVRAQTGGTFTARATILTEAGTATAPLAVTVRRFSTDAEWDALTAAVEQGGTAVHALLSGSDDLGTVQLATQQAAIKFAYDFETEAGRLITVMTAEPILFKGAGLPVAQPTAGYDFGLVLLEVLTSGGGNGDVVPAAKLRFDAQGALGIEHYSGAVIRLSNVAAR